MLALPLEGGGVRHFLLMVDHITPYDDVLGRKEGTPLVGIHSIEAIVSVINFLLLLCLSASPSLSRTELCLFVITKG